MSVPRYERKVSYVSGPGGGSGSKRDQLDPRKSRWKPVNTEPVDENRKRGRPPKVPRMAADSPGGGRFSTGSNLEPVNESRSRSRPFKGSYCEEKSGSEEASSTPPALGAPSSDRPERDDSPPALAGLCRDRPQKGFYTEESNDKRYGSLEQSSKEKRKSESKGRPAGRKDISSKLANKQKEEEIVILDESDNDDPEASSSSANLNASSSKSSDGPEELCTFNRETITEHDYKTLAEHEYLNDNIINFYLTYLHHQLPSDIKDLIHIYSSHFYSRLKGSSKREKGSEKKEGKTHAELCYDRVKSWTKKIDIFSKRMLIFPICDEEHWFVIIVCNPGLVLSQKRQRDFEIARKKQQKLENRGINPFLLVLDSLSGTHSTALNKIRSYLQFEYLSRKNYPLTFGRDKMNEKHPDIPLQPNSCDCGIFLLHYVELIFKDPGKFLGATLPDLSRWFKEKEIDYKRHDIACIIKDLAVKQYKEQKNALNKDEAATVRIRKPKFPHIRYPAKREKTDRGPGAANSNDPRLKGDKRSIFGGRVPSIPEVPGYNESAVESIPLPPAPPPDNGTPPQPPPPLPSRVAKGGPPRTPPYPPPPTDSDSSPSPPPKRRSSHHSSNSSRRSGGSDRLLNHFPQFISDSLRKRECTVGCTRLDDASDKNRKFFKHNRDDRHRRGREEGGGGGVTKSAAEGRPAKKVINSKREMFQELMKGCE